MVNRGPMPVYQHGVGITLHTISDNPVVGRFPFAGRFYVHEYHPAHSGKLFHHIIELLGTNTAIAAQVDNNYIAEFSGATQLPQYIGAFKEKAADFSVDLKVRDIAAEFGSDA